MRKGKRTVGDDYELIMELRRRGNTYKEIGHVTGWKPASVSSAVYYRRHKEMRAKHIAENAKALAEAAANEAVMAVANEEACAAMEAHDVNMVADSQPVAAIEHGAEFAIPRPTVLTIADQPIAMEIGQPEAVLGDKYSFDLPIKLRISIGMM